MENQFTVISYNKDDLQLIKKAQSLLLQKPLIVHTVHEPQIIKANDPQTNDPQTNVPQTNVPLNVETQYKKDIINKFHIIIKEQVEIDIINKSVIKIPFVPILPNITVDFTNDNTILINNYELAIPFQIKYIKVFGGSGTETEAGTEAVEGGSGTEAVDSINFIKEITYNKTKYIIKINSNKYRDFIITDDKYIEDVDKYYNFINEYCNRDKRILTPDEILKKSKYNELNIKINMTDEDIENFIDELNDEIDFKNLEFDIENWKKKDYIILRTLNDLLVALFHNIMNDFNILGRDVQLIIVKQLINMYLKYHDNIVFLKKCSLGNNDIYITIIMKVFEFYTNSNIVESILCFIKYAPKYCNENYYPVPYSGKIFINDEHEIEILNNKYLRQIYLDNKHCFI